MKGNSKICIYYKNQMKTIIYTPGHLVYVNCNSDTEQCQNNIGKICRLLSHTFTDYDNDDDYDDDDNL
jgi:hypothetical protein